MRTSSRKMKEVKKVRHKGEKDTEVSTSMGEEEEPCAPCPCEEASVDNQLKKALVHFWMEDYVTAASCACNVLKKNKHNQLALSVSQACWSGSTLSHGHRKRFGEPKVPPSLYPTSWEVLGPIPAGKLEIDGDPSFDSHLRALSSRLLRDSTNSSSSDGMHPNKAYSSL